MMDAYRFEGGYMNHRRPMWLKGLRLDRFQVTFSVTRDEEWGAISFYFNGKDIDNYERVKLHVHANNKPQDAETLINGVSTYHASSNPNSMPSLDIGEKYWYRITNDGTTLRIMVQQSATKPGSWNSGTDTVFVCTEFDNFGTIGGGMIGFGYRHYDRLCSLDDLTVESDRDANGSYETVEHIDHFTADSDGNAEQEPEHDRSGNLTYDGIYHYTYDAWNRMTKVTKAFKECGDSSGGIGTNGTNGVTLGSLQLGSVVNEIQYDGLHRRIVKEVKNSADLDMTYHYYYNNQSIIEIHNGSEQVIQQFVWGQQYIDELVEIGINDDPIGDSDFSESENFRGYYTQHNANFNVIGLTDAAGNLVERYEYTPYGQRQVYKSAGANDPDAHAPLHISSRVEVSSVAQPYALNPIGHQGLLHDEATGLVYNRYRMLNSRLQRFNQRDPLGYVDGMNTYTYYAGLRGWVDPFGLEARYVTIIDSNGKEHRLCLNSDIFTTRMPCVEGCHERLEDIHIRTIDPDEVKEETIRFVTHVGDGVLYTLASLFSLPFRVAEAMLGGETAHAPSPDDVASGRLQRDNEEQEWHMVGIYTELAAWAAGSIVTRGFFPRAPRKPSWNLGDHKSATKWQNQMKNRGWTPQQIDEAVAGGQKFPATNNVNTGNSATRYVHPETGRSVVVDDVTSEVLHVGSDGFKY